MYIGLVVPMWAEKALASPETAVSKSILGTFLLCAEIKAQFFKEFFKLRIGFYHWKFKLIINDNE